MYGTGCISKSAYFQLKKCTKKAKKRHKNVAVKVVFKSLFSSKNEMKSRGKAVNRTERSEGEFKERTLTE